ncbi:MAG: hypothetical protein ACYC59_07450 [Anaerolineaceae bacterium]
MSAVSSEILVASEMAFTICSSIASSSGCWWQDYVYEVRQINNWVDPQDFSIMEEEEFP